jgi:hypothetical protein
MGAKSKRRGMVLLPILSGRFNRADSSVDIDGESVLTVVRSWIIRNPSGAIRGLASQRGACARLIARLLQFLLDKLNEKLKYPAF